MRRCTRISVFSLVLSVIVSAAAFAASNGGDDAATWKDWMEMRQSAVHASTLLNADVSSGLAPVGRVDDLLLGPENSRIQYILYDVPYPYGFFGGEDGFVAFDSVDLENTGYGQNLRVRFVESGVGQMPKEFDVKRADAADRLVSRIMGAPMRFNGGETRDVEDLLINPETGTVTHFIVQMEPNAIFSGEPRVVPADLVSLGDGAETLVADIPIERVERLQKFDPALL